MIKIADNNEVSQDKPKNKGGRPRKYKSVRQLTMAINRYFTDDVIPTKAGLTLHLGFCDKVSLLNYRDNHPEFTTLIKKTFTRIEQFWEQRLIGTASTGSIFWLKNNAGYTDKVEHIEKTEPIKPLTVAEKAIIQEAASKILLLKLNEPQKAQESA